MIFHQKKIYIGVTVYCHIAKIALCKKVLFRSEKQRPYILNIIYEKSV